MLRFFSTTLGQILAIIATSSAVTFLLFLTLVALRIDPPKPPWPWPTVYPIVSFVNILKQAPEAEREQVLRFGLPGMTAALLQAPNPCATLTLDSRDLERVLRNELGEPGVVARACEDGNASTTIQALIPLGGQTLEIRTNQAARSPPRFQFPLFDALLFMCVGVAAMSAWAVWRVIRPLRRLSEQTDAFGDDISVSPIAEEGPLEIRRAAAAFNRMQRRVAKSVEDRTRVLAAISHDLRTPLTRMRLQLEAGEPGKAHAKLTRDVALMQAMTDSALAYLSGQSDKEEKEFVDLGALLATLSDEYEERGAKVLYEGREQISLFCRPNALTRALTNLIENGVHYGSTVTLSASASQDCVTIEISDDGPGLPEHARRDVLEPFVRLDPSRADRPGSVGLGLSIVNEILRAHGGRLELLDAFPHGLLARMTLPNVAASL